MWRYRELLPHLDESDVVTLGEGMSPLLPCPRLGKRFGLSNLWIKDESQLPTGSFKSRGHGDGHQHGEALRREARGASRRPATPAGRRRPMRRGRAWSVSSSCPRTRRSINQYECQLAGAKTFLVNGLINDCGRIVREGNERMGWFDLSTLKEPYRLEGKKTMGLELAEQFGWRLPDVILYPTGGGTGLIGMWKAFAELRELGWLQADKLPRMVSVQSDGCCPIVRAFEQGERFAEPFANAPHHRQRPARAGGRRRLHDARRHPRKRRDRQSPWPKQRSERMDAPGRVARRHSRLP